MNRSMASIVGPGGRFQAQKVEVTAGLPAMLGVQPILGRSFRDDENDPGRNRVVLHRRRCRGASSTLPIRRSWARR